MHLNVSEPKILLADDDTGKNKILSVVQCSAVMSLSQCSIDAVLKHSVRFNRNTLTADSIRMIHVTAARRIQRWWRRYSRRRRIESFHDCISVSGLTPNYIFVIEKINCWRRGICLTFVDQPDIWVIHRENGTFRGGDMDTWSYFQGLARDTGEMTFDIAANILITCYLCGVGEEQGRYPQGSIGPNFELRKCEAPEFF
jgi:hypothetical protein